MWRSMAACFCSRAAGSLVRSLSSWQGQLCHPLVLDASIQRRWGSAKSGLHLLARKVHRRKTAERTGFDLQTHMKDLLDGREVGVFWDWRSAGIPFRHATKVPAPLQEMFLGWGAPKVTTRIYTDRGHNPTPDVTFKRLMLQDVPIFLTGGKQRVQVPHIMRRDIIEFVKRTRGAVFIMSTDQSFSADLEWVRSMSGIGLTMGDIENPPKAFTYDHGPGWTRTPLAKLSDAGFVLNYNPNPAKQRPFLAEVWLQGLRTWVVADLQASWQHRTFRVLKQWVLKCDQLDSKGPPPPPEEDEFSEDDGEEFTVQEQALFDELNHEGHSQKHDRDD